MLNVNRKHENANGTHAHDEKDAMAHELVSAFEAATGNDAVNRTNALLIHACSCDDVQCRDQHFHGLCSHMKRFLRAACWASHNEQWLAYPIAHAVIELFTYHALHCQARQCNVPMCRQLRGQVVL